MRSSSKRGNSDRRRMGLTRVGLRRIYATRLYGRSKRNLFINTIRRRDKGRMIIPTNRRKRGNLRYRDKLRGKRRSLIRNMRLTYAISTNDLCSLRKGKDIRVLLRRRRRNKHYGTKRGRQSGTILRTRLNSRLRGTRDKRLHKRNRSRRSGNRHNLFRFRIVNMSTMNHRNQRMRTRHHQTNKSSRTITSTNSSESIDVNRRILRINSRQFTQRRQRTFLSLRINTNKISRRRVRRRRTRGTSRRRRRVAPYTTYDRYYFFQLVSEDIYRGRFPPFTTFLTTFDSLH